MAQLPIGAGTPSPGVCCAGPACWEKTTRKYGLRNLPLCDACAAALCGQVHAREPVSLPRSIARHPAGRKLPAR
jgi:hypothetical protein